MSTLIYIFFGLFLSLIPLLMKVPLVNKKVFSLHLPFKNYLLQIALLSLIIFFLILKNNLFFAFCCSLLALFLSYKDRQIECKTFIVSLLFLLASSKLLWWYNENISPYEWQRSIAFLLLSSCLLKMLSQPSNKKISSLFLYSNLFVFVLIAGFFSFNTGLFSFADSTICALHHWGAYIGPSQAMTAGARIFYDIPMQYGFGPTALLSLIHKSNFWLEMYYLNSIILFLYALFLFGCILVVRKNNLKPLEILIFLLACFVTTFFWTGFPPTATFTSPTPSVTGLRFLPVVVMSLLLFLKTAGYKYFQSNILIHFAWCFGVLWSPESAFYVTFVWWPYYLLLKYQNYEQKRIIPIILQGMVILIAWLLSLLIVFILIYYVIYGIFPSIYSFLEYAINPPGPSPVSVRGTVWFFLSVMVIGVVALYKEFRHNPNKKETYYLFITVLMAYAVSSYFFLGRAHSNNILNLTPFMLLALIAMHSTFKVGVGRISANILIVSLISYSIFFGWQSLRVSWEKGTLYQFNPHQLVNNLSNEMLREPDGPALKEAINFIQNKFQEPLLVLNSSYNLVPTASDEVWSALHGPANFAYMPSNYRRICLQRTMQRLRRTGWLIIDKKFDTQLLDDYDTAYKRDKQIDFGSYYAIRFVPRLILDNPG